MRHLVAVGAALLLLCGQAGVTHALMLDEKTEFNATAFGWTFLGMSLVSLAYASESYSTARSELELANEIYALYEGATTAADATTYRQLTTNHLNNAEAAELRTNVSFYMAILFGITSYYSFAGEGINEKPFTLTGMTLTPQGFSVRFTF